MDLAAVDHILTTTRSVRRRLDFRRAVDPAVLQECLEIAVQAPAGGNLARYHFVIVTDPSKRAAVSDYYRRVFFEEYLPRRGEVVPDIPERERQFTDSAAYLAQHLHEVPVLVIPCVEGRLEDKGPMVRAASYGTFSLRRGPSCSRCAPGGWSPRGRRCTSGTSARSAACWEFRRR